MSADKTPFEILGISPEAELVVVNAAYKALARRYHPDMNPGVSPAELNKKMAEINWAKQELERDLEGWRRRAAAQARTWQRTTGATRRRRAAGEASAMPTGPVPPQGAVRAQPEVIVLAGRRGSAATFAATAPGLAAAAIRARFKSGCIEVQRLQSDRDSALFGVTVTEDFTSDVPDNAIETVELVAPGFVGSKVFVSIAPVSREILSQQYGGRVAPPRHASYRARISFGKHRGRTFEEIAVEEPGYLQWMLREGAGSRVERDCARMALDQLAGGRWLPRRQEARRYSVRPAEARYQPPALPDPNRPGGLLRILKALFSPKEPSG